MHLSPRWLRLLSGLRQRFYYCWYIVLCTSHCLWGFCVGLCFGMYYFMFFLLLQSWRERESCLLCFYCLSDVLLLLMFCGSSSRCRGLVCSVGLWFSWLFLLFYGFVAGSTRRLNWQCTDVARNRTRGPWVQGEWIIHYTTPAPQSMLGYQGLFSAYKGYLY